MKGSVHLVTEDLIYKQPADGFRDLSLMFNSQNRSACHFESSANRVDLVSEDTQYASIKPSMQASLFIIAVVIDNSISV